MCHFAAVGVEKPGPELDNVRLCQFGKGFGPLIFVNNRGPIFVIVQGVSCYGLAAIAPFLFTNIQPFLYSLFDRLDCGLSGTIDATRCGVFAKCERLFPGVESFIGIA